jgi:hypothetical protein
MSIEMRERSTPGPPDARAAFTAAGYVGAVGDRDPAAHVPGAPWLGDLFQIAGSPHAGWRPLPHHAKGDVPAREDAGTLLLWVDVPIIPVAETIPRDQNMARLTLGG